MKNLPKPLHEYRREPTQEELDLCAKYVAEGKCQAEIARATGWTKPRTKTLMNRVDVMQAAHKLRMTDVIPEALRKIVELQERLIEAVEVIANRQTHLEGQMRKMNRTVLNKQITINKGKETIKALRTTEKELRTLIRKRGFV